VSDDEGFAFPPNEDSPIRRAFDDLRDRTAGARRSIWMTPNWHVPFESH
jgi:hypothetical protein